MALLPPLPWLPVDTDILQARERLAANLRRLGANVEETQPEMLGDGRAFYQLYFSLIAVVMSQTMPAWMRGLAGLGTRLSRD